ncbi:maleylpyruvate isomerase family mycothiol-dependent enzyme [Dactylosporangium sp. NPDC049525]|uniref:maleylpyruvate isomerase family mycothiol-dependent enzyme n=1 Tax=Dactylosporangium sp. NPDC049525 TaxID=3154730 RepID=UPI00341DEB9C
MLEQMRAGEAFVAATVAGLDDADLGGPSLLPGWTRAHVIGHLARNAEALGRLAAWARTGVETPMYRDPQQRAAEIAASAGAPAAVLRDDLRKTAAALDAALGELDHDTWLAPVRSATGRTIRASEIPWLRVREVYLHAVDLGAPPGTVPGDVVDALLDDIVPALTTRDGCPAVLIRPADRTRVWALGGATTGVDDAAITVRGTAADALAWLVGRADDPTRPQPPRWL